MPAVACAAGRAPHGPQRDALDRERGAGGVARGRLELGTPCRAAFAGRVRGPAGGDLALQPLLAILATMLDQPARLTRQVPGIVRDEEVCRRLTGVPGVGPITAPALRATSRRRAPASIPRRPGSADPGGDRLEHCRRSREVGADPGLTPARPTGIQGRVSRCRDGPARAALHEAALSLLMRGRTWSSLRAWGMQVAKHRGMVRARVAVARKLAVVLHRMWSDQTGFRFGKEPAMGTAAAMA